MSIHHCFDRGSVVPDLKSTDKFDAIREIIHRASVFREIEEGNAFEEAVIARERLQSTGFGHGVAVAHGRCTGVGRVLIGMGISRHGILYDSPDAMPVHLLFVIASPARVSIDYLQALSTLVRCVRHQDVRASLLAPCAAEELESRMRSAFTAHIAVTDCDDAADGRQPCGAAG
jgi:mannitol/fructose-specific phosphotransferase system IIA component (Ntr-type)